ncbi:Ubiquitin carboxyl-terminal hydrolase 8 [Sparganum proliferum]
MDIYNKASNIRVDGATKTKGGHVNHHRAQQVHLNKSASTECITSTAPHSKSSEEPTDDKGAQKLEPAGLENMGNSCYLNAILQCIQYTESLRNYCLEKKYESSLRKSAKTGGDLFPALGSVLSKMQAHTGSTVPTSAILRIKNVFAKVVPSYAGNLQQDALEFLTYLLDLLHEETKICLQEPPKPRPNRRSVHQLPPTEDIPPQNLSPPTHPADGVDHPPASHSSMPTQDNSVPIDPLPFSISSHSELPAKSPPRILPSEGGLNGTGSKGTRRSVFRRIMSRWKAKSRSSSKTRQSKGIEGETATGGLLGSAEAAARERSFLKETFVGHLQSRLRCCRCNNLTTRNELFWNLALCVPEEKAGETERSSVDEAPRASEASASGLKQQSPTGKPSHTKNPKEDSDSHSRKISTVSSVVSDSSTTSSVSSTPSVSLKDCLDAFTKVEVLDGDDRPTCEHCKEATKAKFQVLVSRLPDILVLQFLRFDSSSSYNKRRNLIDFDFELDLKTYTTKGLDDSPCCRTRGEARQSSIFRDNEVQPNPPSRIRLRLEKSGRPNRSSTCLPPQLPLPSPAPPRLSSRNVRLRRKSHSSSNLDTQTTASCLTPSLSSLTLTAESPKSLASLNGDTPCQEDSTDDLENTRYRLYGVVYHRGCTDRGHYTAKCLVRPPFSKEPGWYNFDDENVSPITDLREIVQSSAYILFYERIKEPQLSTVDEVKFHIDSEGSEPRTPPISRK